ncbi:unnamed protein product [Sphenostylis stenocarpa]|uniref:Uncharacterized protein n=1 Tax=Sphenostylis stenocarpa TaxID=92480 RepID=A0AA86SPP1_9FABA|nr:unnamed protein product [Sphenostylis stenocarpa]
MDEIGGMLQVEAFMRRTRSSVEGGNHRKHAWRRNIVPWGGMQWISMVLGFWGKSRVIVGTVVEADRRQRMDQLSHEINPEERKISNGCATHTGQWQAMEGSV